MGAEGQYLPVQKYLKIYRRSNASPDHVVLRIEIDRETDGRWIVEALDLPGVMSYGASKKAAIDAAALLALRVIDDRAEHGEDLPDLDPVDAPADHAYHA
jgi:predicted RNase H-like HicB family nuclease